MEESAKTEALCRSLLVGSDVDDVSERLDRDPALVQEVRRRLAACGMSLFRAADGRWLAYAGDEDGDLLPDQLGQQRRAILAWLCWRITRKGPPTLSELQEEFLRPRNWQLRWARSALLGSLENRGLIRLRRQGSDTLIKPGPLWDLLSPRAVAERLEAARNR